MTNSENHKITSKCTCPNTKGKETVVITIQTCCKKCCEGAQKSKDVPSESKEFKPIQPRPSAPKTVRSSPELSPVHSLHETPVHSLHEKPRVSSVVVDDSGGGEEPPPESEESIPVVTNYSKDAVKVEAAKNQRVYKLPVVLERHHGPGCAMEISVLEKHEDSCLYKKEEGEGRHVDDRVGSYDCIGRLVFRTCNPTNLDSDSSGATGLFSGLKPSDVKTSANDKVVSKPTPAPPPPTPAPPPPSSPSPNPVREPSEVSGPSVFGSAKSERISPPASPDPSRDPSVASGRSTFGSAQSEQSSPAGSARSPSEIIEEDVKAEQNEPVEAVKKKKIKKNQDHILIATTAQNPPEEKKHFSGDGCKLHGPRKPLLLSRTQLAKASSSKKMFPIYTDGSNQTDPQSEDESSQKSKNSDETISTLNDTSKIRKTKTFWGSLFGKGSVESSSSARSKSKHKKSKK